VTRGTRRDLVVIGASAGGVQAIRELLTGLPAGLPASVAIVLHRHPFSASMLVDVLARRSMLPVAEPRDGEALRRGRVYVAPRDHHMVVDDGRLLINRGPKEHYTRPAVDPLFRSAARSHGPGVIGVILSGSGDDGVSGLIAIKAAGGLSVVQHPGEATHDSMPRSAIQRDDVDAILTMDELAVRLPGLVLGESFELESDALSRPA
jgi:two-component system, chemotaxis family, protein-glutamate methylesterase/glutaminase